jgi:D-alanine transaminase
MSRVAYVDGQYLPHRSATVHFEDRGYQFADGVYEVMAVVGGSLLDEGHHPMRLGRSLAELQIPAPMSNAALRIVYVQIARCVAARGHAFPTAALPVLVVTSRRKKPIDPLAVERGVSVITIPDIRWQRCDIKSVALLPNVLGKQLAKEAGVFEAWQIDREGKVAKEPQQMPSS